MIEQLGDMALFVFTPEGDGPRPARRYPHPAVVVLQEIFGVNDHIQSVCHRLVEAGFVAAAPDLFYRSGARQVIPYSDVDGGRQAAMKSGLTFDNVTADLQRVFEWLKARPDVGEVGVVGFCMGGRLAFMTASSVDFKAAGVFYGGGLVPGPGTAPGPSGLDAAPRLRCPVISFWGGQDKHIPREHVRQLEEAADQGPQPLEVHWYEQADHGFCCDDRASYHPDACRDAWAKLIPFLRRHLQ